jgi:hypothetical protein
VLFWRASTMTDLEHAQLSHEQAKRYLRRLHEKAKYERADWITRAIATAHERVSRTLAALEATQPADAGSQ